MKGKVKYIADRDLSYVQWGNYKVYRYKGEVCKGELGKAMAEQWGNYEQMEESGIRSGLSGVSGLRRALVQKTQTTLF